MKNILVIGSGLTGATLAYKHKEDKVTVIERRNHIGGNIYTEDIDGICVHQYGAHIFHTNDKEIWDFVNQFVHFNNYKHEVKSFYNGNLYSLPINMHTFKEFFGITNPEEIKQEHIDYIKKCLYYGYSAKQWNKSIDKIDPKVFDRLPIRTTWDNNYFSDIYQGIPIEGYTSLIESLLQGCKIILNTEVTKDFDFTPYDLVYNTGPIDKFLEYELGHLEYRSLHFNTLSLKDLTYQNYAVVNFASESVPYTRIIEHKHFNYNGQKDTIVTFEYPYDYKEKREPYYTVNTEVNNKLYQKYKELAIIKYPNMIFCGRLGAYQYYDMDDAIKEAFNIFREYA